MELFQSLGGKIKAVIFDMDGVLSDTFEAHVWSWEQFFLREGMTHDARPWLSKTFGSGKFETIPKLYPGRELTDDFINEKADLKKQFFLEVFNSGKVPMVKGALEFLERLKATGLPLAVATSAPRGNLEAVLELYGIGEYFVALTSGDEVRQAKPAPDIFLLAAERLGMDPKDCVIFEDSTHGINAAKAAGSKVIGVATTHEVATLEPLCDGVIVDFNDRRLGLAE